MTDGDEKNLILQRRATGLAISPLAQSLKRLTLFYRKTYPHLNPPFLNVYDGEMKPPLHINTDCLSSLCYCHGYG
jgi:hypothetical protein